MVEKRSLLHWFKANKNITVKGILIEHTKAVERTCSESINLYKALKGELTQNPVEIISKISAFEEQADQLQDVLAERELIHGEFPPNVQEDLFRMIRRIDEAANWIKTASKNANLVLNLKLNYPDKLHDYLIQLSTITKDSVEIFSKTLQYLGVNDDKVISNRNKIEKLERQGDEVYYLAKETILKLGTQLDNAILFLSLDTAKALENASDACSKASDYLYSIVMAAPVR